ncbi:polyprotein of EF-Ts, chloroplastic [Primulina huaijiensis]|uniref:polyprotein of EF-Ts, chloroplastic n=1 Tax=Primulina huaijiensis TaxID=1492673 RepID=UPI003CC747BB
MAPVLPNSINISLTTGNTFITKRNSFIPRCSIPRNYNSPLLPAQNYILPLSTSLRLFPQFRIGFGSPIKIRTCIARSTGTDVAVEAADLSTADSDTAEVTEESSAKSNDIPAQSKRTRPARKSEMPPLKNEQLIPGATFTGKVRSIQPFGAFVDFGAYTDGLVHVSNLSDSFVKDVASVVAVGQEVTVRLIESNMETGRISLSMRESDDGKQQKDSSRPTRKTGQKSDERKDDVKKKSKFVKGQDLEGTVKNVIRSGAFISLPDGEEGFLPTLEEPDEGFGSLMGGGSSLEIGQEVNVRVLRISRGQVTLTMKKEEDAEELDTKLSKGGVVHTATNPFVLAFRSNKVISDFLDERKNEDGPVESAKQDHIGTLDKEERLATFPDSSPSAELETETFQELEASSVAPSDDGSRPPEDRITEEPTPIETRESNEEVQTSGKISDDTLLSEIVEESAEKEADDAIVKVKGQSQDPVTSVPSATLEESVLSSEITDQTLLSESTGEVAEKKTDYVTAMNEDSIEKPEHAVPFAALEEEKTGAPSPEGNFTSMGLDPVTSVPSATLEESVLSSEITDQILLSESTGEVAEKKTDYVTAMNEDSSEKPEHAIPFAALEEEKTGAPSPEGNFTSIESQVTTEVTENLGDDINATEVQSHISAGEEEDKEAVHQQNGNVSISSGPTDASENGTTTKAAISPAQVKQLREETGAGMMDCKKALSETGGDMVRAQEYLRKKGLASADKKSSRATAEGRIGSYIHDSRIGVLIEVNCETDFVARGDIFKELVEDLAMQVAACPQVQYLNTEDVPKEIVDNERELEMQREDLLSKPEQIRSKIVDGRIKKRVEDMALLEQPFIKDDKIAVKDWVKQTVSTIGENIQVKRFVRYNLGEGLEKKSQDFAAEVAAQTAEKPATTSIKQEPAAVSETTETPPKAMVSATLVKQLREETGAGMMDCKKALAETGGDLEKAQEYLRKKGLSTADKRSSRLASEGKIGCYIHDSRIGVLIEVNCETDFVGRSQNFKELVDDLAMQVVASPQVQYVSVEDIPESIVNDEKQLEMQREDLQSKPENIREKIVEGRILKRLGELALLEQPFIKNDSLFVKDLVKQTVAALGENIKVRRFVRFTLGEVSAAKSVNEAEATVANTVA